MTFNFTPKTDDELNQMKLLSEGTYSFIIKKAVEKRSKSGNEMIEVVLEVFADDGGSRFVSDYLVSTDKMAWKISHFCKSINLISQYETGRLDVISLVGRQGKASVTIEKNDDYPPRNKIKDYVQDTQKIKDESIEENSKKLEIPEDEDLPF
jgi:hypothetical protein